MMRAACVDRYGPAEHVSVREVAVPPVAKDHVLVRTYATTVSSADARIRAAKVPRGFGVLMRLAMGIHGPRNPVLGVELSGVVERVGPSVKGLQDGDAVIAFPGVRMGAHAEWCSVPARRVIGKPQMLSFSEASALCFGGLTALHFLRDGAQLRAGERLLVVGASGTVGSAAVQLGRIAGAEVTAVCSAANASCVEGLGAARVLDYAAEDFATQRGLYDVVFDCVGVVSWGLARHALARGGRFLRAVADLTSTVMAPFQGRAAGLRVVAGVSPERGDDMRHLADLATQGRYRPLIDRELPFEEIVAAHRRVDSQHKRGSVVLRMQPT